MKYIITIVVFFLFFNVKSQQNLTAGINKSGVATIEFNAQYDIKNLIVLIYTEAGETVLFESRTEFKGFYQKIINLREYGSGQYLIRLVRDEDIKQVNLRVD